MTVHSTRETPQPDAEAALDALVAEATKAVVYLGEAGPGWVPERPEFESDVAIVGGGQSGVAVAVALRRAGVTRTTVLDAAPAQQEGVWRGIARMQTLRSTKALPGPEGGIAALSFRAWYEAKFGVPAYEALVRCDRLDWADYVDWYRQAVSVPVRSEVRLQRIEPLAEGFRLHLVREGLQVTETTRKVVLATGMVGGGVPFTPPAISALSPGRWAHTEGVIDFEALRGRRVGVLGAASSAFDAAATALENGAADAHLFSRHNDLVRITTIKGMAYAGVLDHFHEMADADRWHLMHYYMQRSAGPIADTVRRATRLPDFHLHLGEDWQSVRETGEGVVVETAAGRFVFDFVIAGTGYAVNLAARPELADFAARIALWSDRYPAPADAQNANLARHPYLGAGFEFLERQPGAAPFLRDIHCFNAAAAMSHGRAVGEIASLKHGIPRLVAAIGRDLFLADRDRHLERLTSFAVADLTGEEYAAPAPVEG
ncbi:NAD(P)-binding domain-containing protein [Aquabacter cavernae]|uniref:NAD(P)-binding domain-containing protein n=1 Tax=Aquabacter cavernae TaxID=2496029 RepID=UPI000F8C613A|nr:NAD(P)/FAD-dependent oxidoreductase [Aquabacter cavernae]